jgi:hypothetical protein
MGIHTKVVKGRGISFILDEEQETLLDIALSYCNTKEKREDLNKHYPTYDDQIDCLEEMLDVYLPETLEIKNFGNMVIDSNENPYGIMLTGDEDEINKIIGKFNLDKRISDMAEVYIG